MCMKYPSKLIFCTSSKPSEKTACVQKQVCWNAQRSLRCRYKRREKGKTTKQNFFSTNFGRGSVMVDFKISFVVLEIENFE